MSIRRPYRAVGMLLISVLVASVMALACDNADLSTAPPVPGPTTPGAAEKSTQPSTDLATPARPATEGVTPRFTLTPTSLVLTPLPTYTPRPPTSLGLTPASTPDLGDSPSAQLLWSYDAELAGFSSPIVVDGVVYVGTESRMNAFDAISGQLRWRYETETGYLWSEAALSGGIVYFGPYGRHVYAVDAQNGTLLWRYGSEYDVFFLTLADGVVYVVTGENLLALDAAAGELLSRYESDVDISLPTLVNGTLYGNTFEGAVSALDTATGNTIWSHETNGALGLSPAVVGGGVHFGSSDGFLNLLEADSGNLVKRYQIGGEPVAPPVVVDGVVYFGSTEGYVYALDTDTGELLWHYLTGADIFSFPTVADGVVYIASMDNTVYALTAP